MPTPPGWRRCSWPPRRPRWREWSAGPDSPYWHLVRPAGRRAGPAPCSRREAASCSHWSCGSFDERSSFTSVYEAEVAVKNDILLPFAAYAGPSDAYTRRRSGSGWLQFEAEQRGVADDPVGRRGGAAVSRDVRHPSTVTGAAAPSGAGRADQDLVEWVAGDVADLAAVPWLERHPVDGVSAMPGDVGESGTLVEAEVVRVVDGCNKLRVARGIQCLRVDSDSHEDLLGGGRVKQVTALGSEANAVHARLGWPGDAAVGVHRHGVVGQPDAGRRGFGIRPQVDSPDKSREAIGDQHYVGPDQAAAVEPARPFIEGVDELRGHRVTRRPTSEINTE